MIWMEHILAIIGALSVGWCVGNYIRLKLQDRATRRYIRERTIYS